MKINTVAIVGLGSVGAMFGSFFVKALGPENVYGIADADRVARYKKDGIYLNGERLAFHYVTPDEAIPVDLLIFATKYTGLRAAIESARKACGEETIVMSFLNGVISEGDIAAALHPKHLLYTTVQGMDSGKVGNQIKMEHSGYISFNEKDNQRSESVDAVADLLERAGTRYEIPADINRQLYNKWMLNCGVNQTCAYFSCGYGGVQPGGAHRDTYIESMEEARACANAEGIDLTEDDIRYWVGVIDGLNPDGEPSMRQDTKAGRRTEVALFGETVCALGRKHGIPTPVNDMFVEKFR